MAICIALDYAPDAHGFVSRATDAIRKCAKDWSYRLKARKSLFSNDKNPNVERVGLFAPHAGDELIELIVESGPTNLQQKQEDIQEGNFSNNWNNKSSDPERKKNKTIFPFDFSPIGIFTEIYNKCLAFKPKKKGGKVYFHEILDECMLIAVKMNDKMADALSVYEDRRARHKVIMKKNHRRLQEVIRDAFKEEGIIERVKQYVSDVLKKKIIFYDFINELDQNLRAMLISDDGMAYLKLKIDRERTGHDKGWLDRLNEFVAEIFTYCVTEEEPFYWADNYNLLCNF